MKLHEIMEQGFILRAWTVKRDTRGERRVVLKLSKKTSRGERFYAAHSPRLGVKLAYAEFTAPVLVGGPHEN